MKHGRFRSNCPVRFRFECSFNLRKLSQLFQIGRDRRIKPYRELDIRWGRSVYLSFAFFIFYATFSLSPQWLTEKILKSVFFFFLLLLKLLLFLLLLLVVVLVLVGVVVVFYSIRFFRISRRVRSFFGV